MKDTKITTVDLRDSDAGLIIGGKAAGLRRLATAGLPIPPGLVIPAEVDDQELPAIASAIADRFSGDTLAVRSSADAEDLATESFAGQYQTVR